MSGFQEYVLSTKGPMVLTTKKKTEVLYGEDGLPIDEVRKIGQFSKFGDLAERRSAPKKLVERSHIAKVERERLRSQDLYQGKYRPTTDRAKNAYDLLLRLVLDGSEDIGDDVLFSLVDEIILICKNDTIYDPAKEKKIQKLIDMSSKDKFHIILQCVKDLDDYVEELHQQEDEDGVVTVEGAADSSESDMEDEDEDAEVGEADGHKINFQDINQEWFENFLKVRFPDCQDFGSLASEIFEILQMDESNCENELNFKLGYENIDTILKLMNNQKLIVYGLKLERAENRESVIAEIIQDPECPEDVKQYLEKGQPKDVRKAKLLDFDALTFSPSSYHRDQDGKLPPHAEREQFKDYEEIKISPASKGRTSEKLRKISSCPKWMQKAFPSYMKYFNRIQSTVYSAAMEKSFNMLICAPTGAGKTNVAVLTILREIRKFMSISDEDPNDFKLTSKEFKIIYVAPMKALVQEVVRTMSDRLSYLGINVAELTGDLGMSKSQIETTQVIVTTPEKWDIVTRKAGDRTYLDDVRLLIVDEIHLLHDERGAVLEAIISRATRQQEISQDRLRIVGISATLPNFKDVSAFLRVEEGKGLFKFDNTFRPIPLYQSYIGINVKKPFRRQQLMNELTYQKVMEQKSHQTIVFVHTRRDTAKTASSLRDLAQDRNELNEFIRDPQSISILKAKADKVTDGDLKNLLPYGLGIHHAGLSRADRAIVEKLMADKHIKVLCSTATLAWGVNLPARTVIVKGTQVYNPEKGQWMELSVLDIMQMMGRAGRPGMDDKGYGVILTTQKELYYYLSLLNEQLPIESQLMKRFPDMLNAEIVLGNVQSIEDAIHWLSYTYLYVRMLMAPHLYGIDEKESSSDQWLYYRRALIAHSAAMILSENGLIDYNAETGSMMSTEIGRIASCYYVNYHTIRTYQTNLHPDMTEIDLFRVFAMSEEFKYIIVRASEKQEMIRLLGIVPIPVKEAYDEPLAKTNALLQAYISNLSLEGFSILSDMSYIQQSATRLVRCFFDIALSKGWAHLAIRSLILAKMVERRLWSSQLPLRQFNTLSDRTLRLLENRSLTWKQMYDLSPAELTDILENASEGHQAFEALSKFPRLNILSAQLQPITTTLGRLTVQIQPKFTYHKKIHGNGLQFWLICRDVNGDTLLHYEPIIIEKSHAAEEEIYRSFSVPISQPLPPHYFVSIISDRWIGSHTEKCVSLRKLILPKQFPARTELQDQSLNLDGIALPENCNVADLTTFYPQTFNHIFSQTFPSIYHSEQNVYVGCPVDEANVYMMEFGILQALSQGKKVAYVGPTNAIVSKRFKRWSVLFPALLSDKTLGIFTGDSTHDQSVLQSHDLILSTAKNWDVKSRKWNTKALLNVNLFIADELQFVGTDRFGPSLEISISRMRMIQEQKNLGVDLRILGFSAPIANSDDIRDWLGAKKKNSFFFSPHDRTKEIEIHIRGFTNFSMKARLSAMVRPMIQILKRNVQKSERNNTTIFVSTSSNAKLTANQIRELVQHERDSEIFVGGDFESDHIQDPNLKQCLNYGVGYIIPFMERDDLNTVLELYAKGFILVLVAHHELCWKYSIKAYSTIIMGSQYFDGIENRFVDYSITDILQMISMTSRESDSTGRSHLFCHQIKKQYYKKFLLEPFPIESQIIPTLAEYLNSDIAHKFIDSAQKCIDFLSWTFLYRRLMKNPNFYGIHGKTDQHISDFLSETIESSLEELQDAQCISIDENDYSVSSSVMGKIAADFCVSYTTMQLYQENITEDSNIDSLLAILSASTEFGELCIPSGELKNLRKLSTRVRYPIEGKYFDAHAKANLLLQAHYGRIQISSKVLRRDKDWVLNQSVNLLKAMTRLVLEVNGWLNTAMKTIELSQMNYHAIWFDWSPFLQLPHITKGHCVEFSKVGCNTMDDLFEADDNVRSSILKDLNPDQISEFAASLNRFPNVDIRVDVQTPNVEPEGIVTIQVHLRVSEDGKVISDPIQAHHFPNKEKFEEWWILVGNSDQNQLSGFRRIQSLTKDKTITMQMYAPSEPGSYTYQLSCFCDCYISADLEDSFEIHVSS